MRHLTREVPMRLLTFVSTVILSCSLAWPAAATGQTPEERAAAREILAKQGPAIVTVLGTVKIRMTMGGREAPANEENIQANGTTIAADGLVVAPLSALEPDNMMSGLFARMNTGGVNMDVQSELTNLRLRLADGKEVPARVVLRDTDLDLAFLRPSDPLPGPVPFVSASSGSPQAMDLVVVITRLGEVAGWQVSGVFSPVMAVLTSPRTAYFAAAPGGGAVFDATGRFVGIGVMLSKNGTTSVGSMSMLTGGMSALDSLGLLPIVVPADEVREIAKQAVAKGGSR